MLDSLKRDELSLVRRLVRSAILWAVPFLLVSGMLILWFYRSATLSFFDDPLDATATSLVAAVDVDPDTRFVSVARKPLDPRYQRALSGRYWLIGTISDDGVLTPVISSDSLGGEPMVISQSERKHLFDEPAQTHRGRTIGPDEEPLRFSARMAYLPALGDEPLIMLAAADSRPANKAILRITLMSLGLMSLLILGTITAIFMQVRLGLKPIFNLSRQVADVRDGRAAKVTGQYPKEIYPLATELNNLIDHNKDVVERARTHVANLAHALKTPIAVMRNESEQKDSELSVLVSRQTETMRKHVEHHLQRARAAATGQTIGAQTPVPRIINSMVRTMPRIYRDKSVDIKVDMDKSLIFRGQKRDLDEMLGNLFDNAFKWTKSAVVITAKPSGESMMEITISDDGPGIAKSDYNEAIKRGVRLDETTPGTGFGLAIVDDLARAYKGSLQLSRSEIGGLGASLKLPRRVEDSEVNSHG